ncbi:hypothetical protein LIP36_02560 [Amedibacillus dolichus]|uniref:hypothetical protein n=1 Tax=Amedibacillus dolichus TaxID=31971 RepID=UPI001D01AEAD|nr:hypothetical protein [Amedibacillus dolichus]MCB5372492.1 hypothetical protein [Amedibacillus dolichus]
MLKKICALIMMGLLCVLSVPIAPVYASGLETDDLTVERVEGRSLTFDEMISTIAERNNISYEDCLNQYFIQMRKELSLTRQLVTDEELLNRALELKYWEDNNYVSSKQKDYDAIVYVYYSYEGPNTDRRIKKILNVGVDCTVENVYKHFNGTLFINLETQYRYYFKINGAFYNTGTTTVNAGISIGIGEGTTVNFGVSSTDNYYDSISVTRRIVSSRIGA